MKTLFNIIICLALLSCTKDYIIRDMAIQKEGRKITLTFEVKAPTLATVSIYRDAERVRQTTIKAKGVVTYWHLTDVEGNYSAIVEINGVEYLIK